MTKNYKIVRWIIVDDLRNICVKNGWYTCGDNEEYYAMLNKVCGPTDVTDELLLDIALDIYEHSNVERMDSSISVIITEINSIIIFVLTY